MQFLRYHWFDLGLALAVLAGGYVLIGRETGLALVLWLSLISLFIHQAEEYRYPGYFPGMVNTVLFASRQPDRYPLNANTALIINVIVGWLFYAAAAVLGGAALWLGIATILVSCGNIIAHTVLFNIKGKTKYNPGMLTALVLFLPIAVYFFFWVVRGRLASPLDWIAEIILGIVLNYVGIIKLIDWLKDTNTPYAFPARCLAPQGKAGDVM